MKTYSVLTRLGNRLAQPWRRFSVNRRGTVIIIVLALLGLLALIGFFALTFTSQENQSATYFANSPTAKVQTTTLDPNSFFNDILRQVIIGPGAGEKQSSMWGGNKALVPTMFGRDLAPYNGFGVNLIWNGTTNSPSVDQNFDGLPDDGTGTQLDNRAFAFMNLSPAAAAPWQANTTYVTGSFVTPPAAATGLIYVATTPGVSSGSPPSFPSSAGSTVTDNTVTWTAVTSLDLNNFPKSGISYPDPDPNLTYPDFNSAFLASDTLVPNGVANAPVRVITPSYHRPMFLRNLATVPTTSWYTSPLTAPYTVFPNMWHRAIDSTGNVTSQYRFVTGVNPDTSGIGTALIPYSIPGDPANAALTPPWNGGPAIQEGVWTSWQASTAYVVNAQVMPIPPNGQIFQVNTGGAGTSGTTPPAWPTTTGATVTDGGVTWTAIGPTNIGYDVDTDNDGIPDSRYIDWGFPLMTDSSGNQFVALGAIKIIDADSLFNLNVHGNRAAATQIPVPNNFAGGNNPTFLSTSDHGVSASEVNPEWALNARPVAGSPDFPGSAPALTSALQQYALLFRPAGSGSNPTNNFDATAGTVSYELANMEIWNLLNGRPQLAAGTPPTVSGSSLVGRWGENVTRLDPNIAAILAGSTLSAGVSAANDPFPLPGTSGVDDNNNQLEGGTFSDAQGVFHPAFVQPVDFFAGGMWVTGTQGKLRQLLPGATTTAPMGNEQFPAYSQFFIAPTVGWANVLSAALVPGGNAKFLLDEPDETWTEPFAVAQQPNDNIFDASENNIQLSGGDYSTLGSPGRTGALMPFNFVANARAALIRQRFTSTSWDLKSFGKEFFGPDTTGGAGPYDARRLWEFTDTSTGATGAGPFRFPPNFVGTNGSLAPNLPPYTTIAPYTNAIDDATTTASGTGTPSNTFAYPMRTSVSSLLQVLANPNLSSNPATGPYTLGALPQTNLIQPQRLLSVNGLTEMFQNGTDSNGNPIYQFRFRPLTPHPSTAVSTFASTPITPFPSAGSSITIPHVTWISEPEQLGASGGTPSQAYMANQEWLARYDRQRMARDIYTLLYLTGGGADTPNLTPVDAYNYATTPNQPNPLSGVRPLYTDDQLAEMAQFAVNLVDALDPDSNVTLFEYDKDLSDGWNLDDNAYDATHDPISATSRALDRGVVYGIERQQLCLNESMVTLSQPCANSATNMAQNHPDTQWDDTRQWSFFYTELENVGPVPINFNNAQWQIAVKQSPVMTSLSAYYGTGVGTTGEMRLTLVGSNVQSSSTLPTLAAGASTGGTNPRLLIGGMIGSSAAAATSGNVGAIAGPPYTYGNPNPTNTTVAAQSYMLIDPNDATGVPTNSPSANDYQFPIAPRAAYDQSTRPTTSTPYWFGNTTILQPASNGLDLIDTNQANNYWVTQPNTGSPNADQSIGTVTGVNVPIAPGSQLLQFNDGTGTNLLPGTAPVVLRIELKRRADPNRVAILPSDTNQVAEAADNPWITVDYMDVPVNVMALKITGNATDYSLQVQGQLGGYYNSTVRSNYQAAPGALYRPSYLSPGAGPNVSTERSQPLYHDYQLNPFNPATTNPTTPNGSFVASSAISYSRNGGVNTLQAPLWQGNSLGEDNDAAGYNPGTIAAAASIAPHPLYQPHYDRDFTSIGELFNIPLYGQPQAPQWIPSTNYSVGMIVVPCSGVTPGSGGLAFMCTTAGTSQATPPSWPLTWSSTPISDGATLRWTAVAPTQTQMFTGLTHSMGSRVPEPGTTVLPATPPNYTPELLVGTDYVPNDPTVFPRLHYPGYGTAGFRLQHPEGGDQTNPYPNNPSGTSDLTENRWFRALGFLEVPTRSHRGIDEPANVAPYQIAAGSINGSLSFFRTPGKINLNTLRYPDIVAGLVGEPDIFNMNFTPALPSGVNLPANLSIPYLLQDINNDTVAVAPPQNPAGAASPIRDWWEQFIAARDGVDPLPIANGGTGLSIPGLPRAPDGVVPPTGLSVTPGSHPFRGMGYCAYGSVDLNGYNGPLESNLLRSLPGDAVTPPTPAPTFDLRRRLFELGTNTEHLASRDSSGALPAGLDYATKQRLLARLAGNTTTRSNVFFVWIQVDFFQAKDVGPSLTPADTGVVRIGQKLGTSPGYRGFFVIDRSQALSLMGPQYVPTTTTGQPFVFSTNQSFNWQSLVSFRQRIQ